MNNINKYLINNLFNSYFENINNWQKWWKMTFIRSLSNLNVFLHDKAQYSLVDLTNQSQGISQYTMLL